MLGKELRFLEMTQKNGKFHTEKIFYRRFKNTGNYISNCGIYNQLFEND